MFIGTTGEVTNPEPVISWLRAEDERLGLQAFQVSSLSISNMLLTLVNQSKVCSVASVTGLYMMAKFL